MVVARGCRDGKRGDVVQRIQTSNYKMPSSVDIIFSMVTIVKNTVLSFKVAKRADLKYSHNHHQHRKGNWMRVCPVVSNSF